MGIEKHHRYALYTGPAFFLAVTHFSTVPLGGELIEVVSPFQEGTTAGRLLQKRGDGGYMIIMQTQDAPKRKKHVLDKGLGKVILEHDGPDSHVVQYHPKGIKGTRFTPHNLDAVTKGSWCRWHDA